MSKSSNTSDLLLKQPTSEQTLYRVKLDGSVVLMGYQAGGSFWFMVSKTNLHSIIDKLQCVEMEMETEDALIRLDL